MKIFSQKRGLKILFVGTEASPFVKVGGLASVMYSLPKALSNLGVDARVMIPRYLSINREYNLETIHEHLKVPTDNDTGESELICNIKKFTPKKSDDPVISYFLENQEFFEQRANVYGYADDAVRWVLLCRGALEFIKANENWRPDVIVASDWPTGYLPNYLKTFYKNDPILSKITCVFSIHNLYFQGMFDHRYVAEMDYDDGHSQIPSIDNPRLTKINAMRRGIMFADAINTVSPNYTREILTKEYGELLDELLRERRGVMMGILNGIDYEYWNPQTDSYILHQYNASNIKIRLNNKKVLQERFSLPIDENVFVLGIVSRLTKQKGFDLLFPIISILIQELPIQLIVLGEGESEVMGFFHDLETRYPKKVACHLKFDEALPHIVYAGADAVLIPSKFEPCGLVQMEAMRMGAVPIVRKTGGLADSVTDYDPQNQTGTGFTFENYDSYSLMIVIIRAFENYRDTKKWRGLQKRAMNENFSWESSAEKYIDFFNRAIEFNNLSKRISK